MFFIVSMWEWTWIRESWQPCLTFYSYSRRCKHYWSAKHTHVVMYVSFILEGRGRSLAKSPKRTHKVITYDVLGNPLYGQRRPIQLSLNKKQKRDWWNMKTIKTRLRHTRSCYSSHIFIIIKYMNNAILIDIALNTVQKL